MKKGTGILIGILLILVILAGMRMYIQKTKNVNIHTYFNSTSVDVNGNDNIVNVEDE